MLIQEKEQLLRELRSIDVKGRSREDVELICSRIKQLELDLKQAIELSSRHMANNDR